LRVPAARTQGGEAGARTGCILYVGLQLQGAPVTHR
jgi:hypothetical protein